MKRPGHPAGKWALLFALAGAAVMVMGSDEEHGPANTGRAKMQQIAQAGRAIERPAPAAKIEFERLARQKQHPGSGMKIGNAFNAISWHAAPPPPPPAPPPSLPPAPPEPAAPPLPFTYLGHYMNPDSPAQIIILARADRVYTVSEGDVIDGAYRFGPISAGMLEVIYLPLNIKQSLKLDGMS